MWLYSRMCIPGRGKLFSIEVKEPFVTSVFTISRRSLYYDFIEFLQSCNYSFFLIDCLEFSFIRILLDLVANVPSCMFQLDVKNALVMANAVTANTKVGGM